ncbi:methyltransferase domain-containing protein [Candidatus Magnetobacterium casense]|uniref:Methyltransferase domain-containing protein n=1 Tax=Candidatus Magnetobacterium casense TaxID=1455061 RepID=A0ABS6RVS5_9BACT|nr:methyltransferase domain-containing protein [Candidatus Magnetobacterium casensis]MBV6340450.1 methyltransferase domain-containing protein [Candidatus Magnetobacterium casensis]
MTQEYKELLIGSGKNRDKKLGQKTDASWQGLVTLDFNPDNSPDVVWDLEVLPLPFGDDFFDEIHAYDVLEHIGNQGDWKTFFNQFTDFWRILKPNGMMFIIVPSPKSVWAWGDPSHKRVMPPEMFGFLSQKAYEQCGTTPMSDFRFFYKADFEIEGLQADDLVTRLILKAIK